MSGSLSSLPAASPLAPPRWLAPAAAGVPLAYYVATASAHGGLYEEGTFVAAARSLGVPHPPGAPITSLVAAFSALLPVGPLSFRVSVASAVLASLNLALFARALYFTLRGIGVGTRAREALPVGLLALAASWFVAQTPLFFAQATRPNVFAAQFAIAFLVIDALVRFELSEPTDDRRTLYLAAFVQGLAFANHHVFGLLLLAVAAPTLGRVFARRGFLGLMGHVAAPILGFSAWVYVPIRGGLHPFINIGEASRLTRTFWVLNADPWWGPAELSEPDALAQLSLGVSPLPAAFLALSLLAAVGLVLASRSPGPRRFSLLWLITLVVPLASIACILEPKLLLDAWGALVPCLFALVALASCGIGLAVQRLGAKQRERGFTAGALTACALSLALLALHAGSRGLAHDSAPDALDDLGRRNLPTRAVVLSRDMGTWFRHLGAEAEEQLRADVTLVPLGALGYPHMVESISEQAPELSRLLHEAHRSGTLELPPLRAVEKLRPVWLELDERVSRAAYPALEPDGAYERLRAYAWPTPPAVRQREATRFQRLHARLGDRVRSPETATRLTSTHLGKAIRAASVGERDSALLHTELGLAVAPEDDRFLRLRAALMGQRPLAPASSWRSQSHEAEQE